MIAEAMQDGDERRRRGALARQDALARWSWPAVAGEVAGLLDAAAAGTAPRVPLVPQ